TMFKRIGFIALFFLLGVPPTYGYQQIEFVREISTPGNQTERQRQMNAPRAMAQAGERLYLADTDAHRIIVLDQSGKTVFAWGLRGNKLGQFRRPSGIALDEQGRVYVSDTGNNRIQVFNGEGKLLRSFGTKGDAPREFNAPTGIAVMKGLLYVADTGNSRVQIMTEEGIFLRQITVKTRNEGMESPVAVAADVQNKIYVLDAEANNVRIFDASGTQDRVFGSRGS